MGRFKFYVKPFNDDGTYQSAWTNISDDVDLGSMGSLKRSLDNTEYDNGIFKNNGLTITLVNPDGRYSDVGSPNSIFKFRRSNSQVKITWEIMHYDTKAGFFVCGYTQVSTETDIFLGFLNDDALKQEAEDQNLQFKILGRESIFTETETPYSSISTSQTFSQVIYTLLNQTSITAVMTVAQANIVCSTNSVIDTKAPLENTTVLEALRKILEASNSVLYIKNDIVYVTGRTASASVEYTFYGQGALYGIENIIDISEYRAGLNRLFNYLTWTDATNVSEDASSTALYGIRKKSLKSDLITDSTKRTTILNAIKAEFAFPKIEFTLRCQMDYDTIALDVLDRVNVDYPNIAIAAEGSVLPFWDTAIWDSDKFPIEVLPITIDASLEFKILSKDIDMQNQEMVFLLREI